jgi:hypothetical protein
VNFNIFYFSFLHVSCYVFCCKHKCIWHRNHFEQQLLTLPEHLSSPAVFSGVRVTRSLILCFVGNCLYFFFWPMRCLFFFHIQILITTLISSNSFYCSLLLIQYICELYVYVRQITLRCNLFQ